MNRERLTQLIRVLEEVQATDKPWDMSQWYTGETTELTCGTAACALGWASRDLWMQGEGLVPADRPYITDRPDPVNDWFPEYDGARGFLAGAGFFGLSMQGSFKLFSTESYTPGTTITTQMVIARVRELLESEA